MNEVLLTLGFGLVTAAILALSAVAFTLEYAVTNVANRPETCFSRHLEPLSRVE